MSLPAQLAPLAHLSVLHTVFVVCMPMIRHLLSDEQVSSQAEMVTAAPSMAQVTDDA